MSAKIPILHLQFGSGVRGGVANYLSILTNSDYKEFNHFVTVDKNEVSGVGSKYSSAEIIPFSNSYNFFSFIPRLVEILSVVKKNKIEIIHCHTLRAGVFSYFINLFTGVKYIYTGHGLRFTLASGAIGKNLFLLIERQVVSRSFAAVCIREIDQRLLKLKARKLSNKIRFIGTRLKPLSVSEGKIKGFDHANVIILAVGSLTRIKRVDRLIELLQLLESINLPYRAAWLGEGPERSELEKKIFLTGVKLELVGHVDQAELNEYLNRSDLLVMPSDSEIVPLAALEAFSVGLPVLVSRYPGVRHIVDHGRNGIIVNFEKEWRAQVSREFREILSNNRLAQMGNEARRTFFERFNGFEIMAKEYYLLYHQALNDDRH